MSIPHVSLEALVKLEYKCLDVKQGKMNKAIIDFLSTLIFYRKLKLIKLLY